MSSFLVVGSSFVGQGSPLCSVLGSLLQLFRFDVTPLEIGFDGVFVSQLWAALVSLAELELSIHQASWYPKFLHADYMPHPSKLGLDEHGLDAVEFARSRTPRLVMRSCHLIPSMERRARMWKDSSFLTCLRYSVHVSQP